LLLIAPFFLGVLLAAGVILVDALRRRRTDADDTILEAHDRAGTFPVDEGHEPEETPQVIGHRKAS
jgi:hypothetical protein